MLTRQNWSAYQSAAASGATTQIGLLQLVYGRLAQDLLEAANATRQNSIAVRCAASNHALLLLGHLQSWLDADADPALAASLGAFYAMLRRSILQEQAAPRFAKFEELAQVVLDTQAAWRDKEERLLSSSVSRTTDPAQVMQQRSISCVA